MSKQQEKKVYLLIVSALILLAIAFLYPSALKLRDRMHTYSSPVLYGKEIIYPYIERGDLRIADEILQNKFEISRFDTIAINELTWKEDPFSDLYWRFNFYNLEPVRNLLFAWETTGEAKYKDKLIEITESFIDHGTAGPYSWDYHGTAFRTMTLIDVREKLLQKNALPTDLDKKILETLKRHGDFLSDSDHFEKEYNHGLDQAAALYLLAINHPDLPGADAWLKLSSERMTEVLSTIIDNDGVLVENSPYYHLYVLEKIIDISRYLKQNKLTINGFTDAKIDRMVSYMVYMLQPDSGVPTIGASIGRQINLSGIYKEIAQTRPDLLYVLSQGVYGEKPAKLNVQYPVGGQTIMRSGWGKKESFVNQTQLIFDVGEYRTNHSDFDALSFNLFGRGIALMPDAGLYSYDAQPYRSYFHGTKSHNTVVVDGKDQNIGNESSSEKVTPGFFKEGEGFVYQSGQHTLYDGVSHERAMVMIEDSTILILDNLKSSSDHTYEQMFHLFPGAKVSVDGLTLKAQGEKPDQSLTIKQFATEGLELKTAISEQNPPNGLCSSEYNATVPCYAVSYAQKGKDVSFVTAISIGKNTADVQYNKENNTLTVKTKTDEYSIKINEVEKIERKIEVNKKIDTTEMYSVAKPANSLNTLTEWQLTDNNIGANGESVSVNKKEQSIKITTPSNGLSIEVAKKTNINLSNQNIYFKIKVNKSANLEGIDISLSNSNWEKDARYNIDEVGNYQYVNREDEWVQFGVGKGKLRKSSLGNWIISDPSFNWSKVDGVMFTARSKQGKQATIDIKEFSLVPDQNEARAVIVFDDGWSSVMDAAASMKKVGLRGNVAVITESIGKKSYLTLDNIRALQNDNGWNIASHSSLHKNAIDEYETNNTLMGLDKDIGDALEYLIQNGVNSAPNWYIYPDGSTDGAVKKVIGGYYKFARSTAYVPMVFPFPDPLEVGVFPVYSDRTITKDVHNAISDAIKYKQTIFLMFHKISPGAPTVFTEYSLNDFDTILKDIKDQGIKVVTLSELDKENGIPETEFVLHQAIPAQLSLEISSINWSGRVKHSILNAWNKITGN